MHDSASHDDDDAYEHVWDLSALNCVAPKDTKMKRKQSWTFATIVMMTTIIVNASEHNTLGDCSA